MSAQEVMDLMESSRSESEWNDNADKVKKACHGYRAFWFAAVVLSGLMSRTVKKWSRE